MISKALESTDFQVSLATSDVAGTLIVFATSSIVILNQEAFGSVTAFNV